MPNVVETVCSVALLNLVLSFVVVGEKRMIALNKVNKRTFCFCLLALPNVMNVSQDLFSAFGHLVSGQRDLQE